MRIEVAGIPAPQGNHRVSRAGAIYETSRAVGPWREAVRAETQRVMSEDGKAANWWPTKVWPVTVEITFRLPKPKSTPKSQHWPIKRPDLDKLARAVLDGLTDGGAFADDSLIVDLLTYKRFANELQQPGCVIYVLDAVKEYGQ